MSDNKPKNSGFDAALWLSGALCVSNLYNSDHLLVVLFGFGLTIFSALMFVRYLKEFLNG